ncbi:MAG: hypothetical protein DRO39_06990 [Thermoprotei archaeon]|nr:MAG: hypothetical protein DRO39_06990 [Thermoprotei archaeon]
MVVTIRIPENLARRVRELGVDIESLVIEVIAKELRLDPAEVAEAHLELAEKFLEEGRGLVDKDSVQASEKLYKAAEECVKALATLYNLKDVLSSVRSRGRWSISDLERAAEAISDRLGTWFYDAWDHAWVLHAWGFHEARLDSRAVKRRLPYIERIIEATRRAVRGS